MKKALSIILCLAMLMTTVPMSVFAAPSAVTNADSVNEFINELPEEQEKFVQNHVKPKYDEGCIFMYQPL